MKYLPTCTSPICPITDCSMFTKSASEDVLLFRLLNDAFPRLLESSEDACPVLIRRSLKSRQVRLVQFRHLQIRFQHLFVQKSHYHLSFRSASICEERLSASEDVLLFRLLNDGLLLLFHTKVLSIAADSVRLVRFRHLSLQVRLVRFRHLTTVYGFPTVSYYLPIRASHHGSSTAPYQSRTAQP